MTRPELASVALFEAGVEPKNVACRRCLDWAGLGVRSRRPDDEGFLDDRAARPAGGAG